MRLTDKSYLFLSKFCLVTGYLLALLSSLSINDKLWEDCYYHLFEGAFFFYLLSTFIISSKGIVFNSFWKSILLMILLSSLSTLHDELSGSVKVIDIYDLIRFLIVSFTSFGAYIWLKSRERWNH